MRWVEEIGAAYQRSIERARKHSRTFDHVWLATERFGEVLGGRLAAAISYYGFFAAFSLVVVVYSIFGRVVRPETGEVVETANEYLDRALPFLATTAQTGTGQVTALSAVALVLTGVGWVEALRSSQRAVWGLNQHPGHWVIRRLVDLGMLVGLGVLLALSLATTTFIGRLVDRLAEPRTSLLSHVMLGVSGPVLELVVNIVLAGALLAAVPRLQLSPRRLVPAALVVAVGIQLLNTLGRWYIAGLADSPAYQVVVGAVGLLVYLYLLNQLIIFGAALAATATEGSAADLASGTPVEVAAAGAPGGGPPGGGPSGSDVPDGGASGAGAQGAQGAQGPLRDPG